MSTNKYSRWYKVVGGDFGWYRFDCLYCLRNSKYRQTLKTPRWQGPASKAISKAMKNKAILKCTKNH